MRYLLSIIAIAAFVASAQDAPITREGNYWVRTTFESISGPLPPRLQVSARAHMVLRGTTGDQIIYRVTRRVRASAAGITPMVERRLMGTAIASRALDL